MKTNLRIGEVLMERGCITQEQMEQALAYQKEHREKRVGQILIELGFITETHVLEALAARLGLEIVSIDAGRSGRRPPDPARAGGKAEPARGPRSGGEPRDRDERSAQLLCL